METPPRRPCVSPPPSPAPREHHQPTLPSPLPPPKPPPEAPRFASPPGTRYRSADEFEVLRILRGVLLTTGSSAFPRSLARSLSRLPSFCPLRPSATLHHRHPLPCVNESRSTLPATAPARDQESRRYWISALRLAASRHAAVDPSRCEITASSISPASRRFGSIDRADARYRGIFRVRPRRSRLRPPPADVCPFRAFARQGGVFRGSGDPWTGRRKG